MIQKIIGHIIQANKIFKMIENNDRICVGVSGGKDSTLLLYCLSIVKRILAKDGINFDVVGVHLKMNLCAIDYDAIIEFWKKQNIEFYIKDTKMGEILRANMKHDKIKCSLCSKMKKSILIEEAKKYNCNKVAMGHHADDAIETLFLNLINEARIATFKPKMFLDKNQIWFIRPLITTREKEIMSAIKKLDAPIMPCGCPMEGFTQRDSIKLFLKKYFYENKKWKKSYLNFYIALMNGKSSDLWFYNKQDDKRFVIDEDLRDKNKD